MRMFKRLWIALVLVAVAGLPIYAQQVQEITRGTAGVGRMLVGLGTQGAATLVNARTTLTNAQVLLLGTTGVTVAAAPGAGYFIDVIDGVGVFDYTGAYTAGAGVDLKLFYSSRTAGNAASNTIETTGWLDATEDKIIAFSGTPDDTIPSVNTAVVIQGISATNLGGGNASNRVHIDVTYMIRRTGL